MFDTGMTAAMSLATIAVKLQNLRSALSEAAELQAWAAGVTAADLTADWGMDPGDAATVLSAVADASALHDLYADGLPPASYPQPPSEYKYGASQRRVIGCR